MIAEALGRLFLLLGPALLLPEARAAGLLIVAAALTVAALVAVVLGAHVTGMTERARASAFADVRVHLRSSDPDAAGHRRARAPGRTT